MKDEPRPGADTALAPSDDQGLPPEIADRVKKLDYQSGAITLPGGLARLNLPDNLRYLNSSDAAFVLHDLWGNPPESTLGLLVPKDFSPLSDDVWAVAIDYENQGHVTDKDAQDINYDDLLKSMRQSENQINEERKKAGYPEAHLLGWAEPPHYDPQGKKLYWAKEIKFGGMTENTLNYNIRALGREGVLNLNFIGTMNQLPLANEAAPSILKAVEFTPGNRYDDFNSGTDKMAEYGIAGLIAGGIAVKSGLLKALGLFLVKLWKPVALAVAAVGVGIKRFFGKKA